MELKSFLLRVLQDKGYIHQCTDLEGLDALAESGHITAYVGFDATADSLHVGSLVSLMMLRLLKMAGGTPIALLGTGTTKIGDPSDKNVQRPMLSDEQIRANVEGIKKSIEPLLFPKANTPLPNRAKMIENGDWLNGNDFLEFMRKVGPHFTVNRMLTMEFVRNRLENQLPLTMLEFNYMILQAYDFVELHQRENCVLQMGGSDQWGNIVNGIELGRRMHGAQLFGLTTPLITTSSGTKMGKTGEGKTIWLNAEKTSVYEYFQFWRNVDDADVFRFLLLFTDLMPIHVDAFRELVAKDPAAINVAKEALALEATKILHGEWAAKTALETSRAAFAGEGDSTEGLPSMPFTAGMTVFDAVLGLGLATSKNEVRRLCTQGGIKINGTMLLAPSGTDDPVAVTGDTVLDQNNVEDGMIRVSVGKKKRGIINVNHAVENATV